MMIRPLLLTLYACFLTTACSSTFEGIKQDWNSLSTTTSEKLNTLTQGEKTTAQDALSISACPEIIIDPQLDSLKEFEDMKNPSDTNLVSEASLEAITSKCDISDDKQYLEMRLDLTMTGSLGPKAKRKDSDRPFFAYPYFISVTDAQGQELAKEIFAASVTYAADQDSIELLETINQRLPLNDDGSTPDYQVHIGFQLTDEQLFYNASQ